MVIKLNEVAIARLIDTLEIIRLRRENAELKEPLKSAFPIYKNLSRNGLI